MTPDFFDQLTKYANLCHDRMEAKGYWQPGDDTPKAMAIKLTRIHGEVSELAEVYRKGSMHASCGKAGTCLSNEEEEFADIILQTLDAAAARGIDIGEAVRSKAEYNQRRPSAAQQGKSF